MKFCVDCKWCTQEDSPQGILYTCTGCLSEVTGRPMRLSCKEARLGPCHGGSRFTSKDFISPPLEEPLNG